MQGFYLFKNLCLFLIDLNTAAPKSREYPLQYAFTYIYSCFG